MELTPASSGSISFDLVSLIEQRFAVATAARVLQVQRQMGEELVRLLDPSLGRNIDACA